MWHAHRDQESYLEALGAAIAARLQETIERHGHVRMAVSGGRSPVALFERLSAMPLDWGAVQITLVDDRFVPPEHEDSNERLVRRHLLVNRAARAAFEGLVMDAGDLEACLRAVNARAGPIHLALLGMGDDGHTASLFPHAPQFEQAVSPSQPARYVHISPRNAPHERLSMSLAALLDTEHLFLGIAGAQKREVYEQAARGPTPELPISLLIAQRTVPLEIYWHA